MITLCMMFLLIASPVIGLASPQPQMTEPPLPIEGLSVTATLGLSGAAHLSEWQAQQKTKIGSPLPHLWLIWRLQQVPKGLISSMVMSGFERFPLNPTESVIVNVPAVGSGLWQLRMLLQPHAGSDQPALLCGQMCIEVEDGVPVTIATLALMPPSTLTLILALDQTPAPDEPAKIALYLSTSDAMLDLQIIEMYSTTVELTLTNLPSGEITIVAVVLSDDKPARSNVSRNLLNGAMKLIIPLARSGTKTRQPTAPLLAGTVGSFFATLILNETKG